MTAQTATKQRDGLTLIAFDPIGELPAIVGADGDPWFVAAPWMDEEGAAVALGYHDPGAALAQHVSPENIRKVDFGGRCDPQQLAGTGYEEHWRVLTLINWTGLFELVFAVESPDTSPIIEWVGEVVLPTLRQHGRYPVDPGELEAIAAASVKPLDSDSAEWADIQRFIEEAPLRSWALK